MSPKIESSNEKLVLVKLVEEIHIGCFLVTPFVQILNFNCRNRIHLYYSALQQGNPRVPRNMWWGSVSFKGSTRVPRLFREIDFLLQHFDA